MASDAIALRLYNTLTRDKAPFVPIDPDNVRMYVCGPTVYDFAHIGNARPVIVFDVLFRLLRHVYGAEHVTYVRNITDVDDKINARAARDFPGLPLNEAIRRVTETTAAQFQKDVAALGCLEPTVQPRATDNIEQMITMVQSLLDRGYAYAARGGEGREVLFDVLSMSDYGRLSRRPLDEQQAGARVAVETHKRNPADFVLWKESSQAEPGWPATFELSEENQLQLGLNSPSVTIRGRPGWHIECSAMSERYLGQMFDIHGGGLDLIFPHHENEIAQSRCAHGTPTMAKVWMHNGFLQVEGQKMSKSLGNFVTINELLETEKFGGRKWPGEVLRLAMLMTHYREPIDFSVARLEEAVEKLIKSVRRAELCGPPEHWTRPYLASAFGIVEPSADIVNQLRDDLNTAAAVSGLGTSNNDNPDWSINKNAAQMVFDALFLGIDLQRFEASLNAFLGVAVFDSAEVNVRVADRLAALNTRDFAKADTIRADLAAQGIQLMDYKDPATGERRTKWEIKR